MREAFGRIWCKGASQCPLQHYESTSRTASSNQAQPCPYILNGAYYMEDRDSGPVRWYSQVERQCPATPDSFTRTRTRTHTHSYTASTTTARALARVHDPVLDRGGWGRSSTGANKRPNRSAGDQKKKPPACCWETTAAFATLAFALAPNSAPKPQRTPRRMR